MKGIQLDLISEARISQMASMEKVRYIIDEVRKGKILVLEKGLNPMEEAKLIEMTMSAIQPDVFSGIEMQSYPANSDNSLLGRFFKKQSSRRLTVIGPANQLKTLQKDSNLISALVSISK
jgi:hypothetical protein